MKADPYQFIRCRDWLRDNCQLDTDECILWPFTVSNRGYGTVRVERSKTESAHRLAYIYTHGSIPEGALIMHTCDTPRCINVRHLRAGTPRDNNRDREVKHRGGQYVLSTDEVREIREAEGYTNQVLAELYGIDASTISRIRARIDWSHLD